MPRASLQDMHGVRHCLVRAGSFRPASVERLAPVMIPAGGLCRPMDAEGREIKLGIVPTKEERDAYFLRDR